MKILLSAYSCLPNAGSEPGIGWNWATGIAFCGHDVYVLTRANRRHIIETECEKKNIRNPKFIFHDLSPACQSIYGLPFGNYVYYILWQYTAANLAKGMHLSENFDQVQHITWGSFRLPSFMGKLGIPFIFGPVAGGEDTPRNLRCGLGLRGQVWDFLRRISNALLTRAPMMSSTYAKATEIVAATPETLQEIPTPYRAKARVQPAVGIEVQTRRVLYERSAGGSKDCRAARLRLLFVGRLLPWKGLHLALKSLAELRAQSKDVCFTIVGAGSDESRLKRLARRLQLGGCVSWVPWMEREDLINLYSNFDLFLFPSLHDSGGMAVLEAMSRGLPVLCLDLGGPALSVDQSCGRVISTANLQQEEVVESIVRFLRGLMAEPHLLRELSEGARRRASSLTWESSVRSVYRENVLKQFKQLENHTL